MKYEVPSCPWCGAKLDCGEDPEFWKEGYRRIFLFVNCDTADCNFRAMGPTRWLMDALGVDKE